ncbi:MAG: ankyrin repeat domain-containing protein [Gemmatimonadaceae bacterium]|nr:ankyrin repeat domain-containing protein [Gemmatimonadaceae bacterium]
MEQEAENLLAAFIRAACVPRDASHGSGTLAAANAILAAHPQIGRDDIHAAAILGSHEAVGRLLGADAGGATRRGGPYDWDALTHLCFSRYLRIDRTRSEDFVLAARSLLEHGANASTGFHWNGEFESAIYGAAGIAHDAELTRLLLEHGADPNDGGETEYHSPEGFDNAAMQVIVESGKLAPSGLLTMLVRKLDWTDFDGAEWLLTHGSDPNLVSHWGDTALNHALGRDNPLRFIELLLDHGAEPAATSKNGLSAIAMAARMARADVLGLFERRGFSTDLGGDHAFLGACARGDMDTARSMVAADPKIVARLESQDAGLLAYAAGAGNTTAVALMLDLGFDITSRTSKAGASEDTALHVAVWRDRVTTVKLLIDRGAPLEVTNKRGETPLARAVRALVEPSEWTPHDSVDLVAALLGAGARADAVRHFPSGVAAADELLRSFGRGA